MSTQVLRDSRGYRLGSIDTASGGVQTIRDAKGYPKGSYDPKTNITRTDRGYPVGTGNILTTLL